VTSELIAGLEIGTTRSVIAMAETVDTGKIKIVAQCSIPSSGVRKSVITQMSQATYSIESLLKSMSDQCGYTVADAHLIVSGPHIKCMPQIDTWPLSGNTVTDDDINMIHNKALTSSVDSEDMKVLDVNPYQYALDDAEELFEPPKGMHGNVLKCYSLVIKGQQSHILDAIASAERAKLEINDTSFAGLCAAMAVLSNNDKRDGTLVIDLGGGTTSFTFWLNGYMPYANVIGVGGDHVTNDISYAFSLNRDHAEKIKRSYASAVMNDSEGRIDIENLVGSKNATISRRALNTVVNARMHELFVIIRSVLDAANLLPKLNGKVLLTGGGAYLNNVTDLAKSVFGRTVEIGKIVPEIEGLEKIENPASYASIAGLLLQISNEMSPRRSGLSKLFGWIAGK
jgi:cell division protein FtsA